MSDVSQFAQKLLRLHTRQFVSRTPTAIMGTIADLSSTINNRPWFRIGMWPCSSTSDQTAAMGLWCTLAYLLERWSDITVYRLFLPVSEGSAVVPGYNFGPDDWSLEDLDENVAISGSLIAEQASYRLVLTIENDLNPEGDEVREFTLVGQSVTDLLTNLPGLAAEIATWLKAALLNTGKSVYELSSVDTDSTLRSDLETCLKWNMNILNYLWAESWTDEQVIADFQEAQESMGHSPFSTWLFAKMVSQLLVPGLSILSDLLYQPLLSHSNPSQYDYVFYSVIAEPLFTMGHVQEAYDLLEEIVEQDATRLDCWFVLGKLYVLGGRLNDAIATFQEAIRAESTDARLYKEYGNTLMLAAQYNLEISDLCLVDPDESNLVDESIEAFERAIESDPADTEARFAQLVQMTTAVEVDEDRLWDSFDELVATDAQGEYVRDIIDSLIDFDIDRGIQILHRYLNKNQRHLYINLALFHLMNEEGDAAIVHLEKARELSRDNDQLADVERLFLLAEDPEFEHIYAELAAMVDAGNAPNADEMEFLDEVVENAPHFIDGSITLARAYSLWEDLDAALEVLLDANQRTPGEPAILEALGKVLWDSNQPELAFTYLNQGLEKAPNHVGLIVRAGQYLFDSGKIADARAYLARAEELEPRNARLEFVRKYIAGRIAENPDLLND